MIRVRVLIGLLLAGAAGCGGPAIPPATRTPHDGTLVALPDKLGFVEVLKPTDPADSGKARAAFYFLNEFRKPMTAPIASLGFQSKALGPKPVDLEPPGGADGPYLTPPFADPGEIDGKLSATIGGKPYTIPVLIR